MKRNKEEKSTRKDVEPSEAARPATRKRLEEATAEEVARAIFRAADRKVKPRLSS